MENSLRLRREDKSLIMDLIGEGINTVEFDVHLSYMKKLKDFDKLYINIAHLSEINNDVLNKFRKLRNIFKEKHVCIINVNAMHNSILNLFEIDKIFQLYMTKADALEGRKPIINRRFKIVS